MHGLINESTAYCFTKTQSICQNLMKNLTGCSQYGTVVLQPCIQKLYRTDHILLCMRVYPPPPFKAKLSFEDII